MSGPGDLDDQILAPRDATSTDFPDLTGLKPEITFVPIAELVPY